LALLDVVTPCILGILSFVTYGLQSRWITLWKEKFISWIKYMEAKGITGGTTQNTRSNKDKSSKDGSSKTNSIEMQNVTADTSTKGESSRPGDSSTMLI